MSGMRRGLNLVFVEDAHARVHGGLSLACAAAALGRPVRLFFQGSAVAAVDRARCWADDMTLRETGVPTVAQLLAQLAELDVTMMACETGMHRCGVTAATLSPNVETGGLVAFLAGYGDAEMVVV